MTLKRSFGRLNATASFASLGTVSSHGADHGADGADSGDVLTRKIRACQSRDEVFALFESSQSHTNGDLNHFHIKAFFNALHKLEGKDVASDARFINLVELARLQFSEADGATLASVIYFCTQLGATLSDDWLAGFWKSSVAKLPGLNARQLSHLMSCTLRACDKMGVVPPQLWMDSLWKSIEAVLPEFRMQGSSQSLRIFGEMGIVPPQFWMDCFWKSTQAIVTLDVNGMTILHTFHACGRLRLTPPQPWLAGLWKSTEDKLSGFNAKGLSSTLLACGRLGLVPPQPWMVGFSTSCQADLSHFNQHELANTLMALALLKQWSSPILKPIWSALQRSLADSAKVDANRNLHLKQMYFAYKVASVQRPGLLAFDVQGLQEEASRWRANQSENETASPLEKEVHKFLADFERGV